MHTKSLIYLAQYSKQPITAQQNRSDHNLTCDTFKRAPKKKKYYNVKVIFWQFQQRIFIPHDEEGMAKGAIGCDFTLNMTEHTKVDTGLTQQKLTLTQTLFSKF